MAGPDLAPRHPVSSLVQGPALTLSVDDRTTIAYAGETVAGLLWRSGYLATRKTPRHGDLRTYFCGMAACFECLVLVDGQQRQGCVTQVQPGMAIRTGVSQG